MKEIDYKEMEFNPFNLLGKEWMLVSAGNEQDGCNTMTISWGHLGCLWGHNDPTAVIYLRPSRYTKTYVDKEKYFTLCVMDNDFKKQMAYLGTVSGRDEDKIAKAGPMKRYTLRRPSLYLSVRNCMLRNYRRVVSYIRRRSMRVTLSVISTRCTWERLRRCWCVMTNNLPYVCVIGVIRKGRDVMPILCKGRF